LFLLAHSALADDGLKDAVRAKDEAFFRAMLDRDKAVLDSMLGADFYAVWPDGGTVEKEGQKIIIGARWIVSKAETNDVKVRTYNDDTAIVTGRVDFEGTYDGKKIDMPRKFTHVWVKQGEDWKLVSRHLSTFTQE
jgi:ketosteroid isomerase-like protein